MDQAAAIASTFSLSGVSATPSAKCLQWTADGQLLVLTKSAVHILTPHVGMSNELTSTVEHTEGKEQDPSRNVKRTGWLRTMIGIDKALVYQWPADCQDWGAVALGSLDQGLRAVTSSPTNLSGDASCLLVVLNSNMELALWGPVKDFLRGEWAKLVDVTAALRAHFGGRDNSTLVSTLCAQSSCIEWSSQADFGLAPTPLLDGSLLAVGNRAGSVSFLRFCGKSDGSWEVRCAATVPLADRWVTHVAWSSWKQLQSGKCEASLACGIADGSIVVLRVVQTLHSAASSLGLIPNHDIQASFEVQDVRPAESDGRGITCIQWTKPSADLDLLVYSKPAKLYLWAMPSDGRLSSLRTVALSTQHLSIGSSALTPVVGVEHARSEDALIVSLADGSFHVVHHLSQEQPPGESTPDAGLSSLQLSRASRAAFVAAEPEKTTKKDVSRLYGVASYDSHAWFAWLHESCRPTDFSYKHDARLTCLLVVARLCEVDVESSLLSNVRDLIAHARIAQRESPLSLLRPALLYLQDQNVLGPVCGRLLGLLAQDIPISLPFPCLVSLNITDANQELRQGFTRSLEAYLFGSDAMLALRIRLIIAELCARIAELDHDRQAFVEVAAHCNSRIQSHVQLAILHHILSALPALADADIPFAMRMMARACLRGSDPDVVKAAHVLSTKLSTTATHNDDLTLHEPCPACHAPIPFQDAVNAGCPNGHMWTRCSVTSCIIATPIIRACSSCNQKALLPLHRLASQAWIPDDVRNSWLAAELLNAARRCLRCGCNFVTLL
ncbi:transcription factor IIIC subunit delta N-term-domain-containing protein [Rhodofomes roseus]|uniref:Transcription factor IIIC subunit delta N-term-domain-containing protein n=1 Tax=Rhodofomes roseus TaxID=34475 RepID=A0ABQ8KPC0_9APHY|nr:transcription factor IIIC subunit delta N-term-domain-containing protein [Rhodofomes roseus]KAH9840069.1 transcription factor IIIC subunit delta N-term-domain-containing protein [Rhodofomes roseus]